MAEEVEAPEGAPVITDDAPNVLPQAPIDQSPVTEWEGQ